MILESGTAIHAEQCVDGVIIVALHAHHRRLSAQLVEQRLGVF